MPGPVFLLVAPVSRALAPEAAAEAEAAEPDRCPSPGSPSRPGRSASPEEAEAVAAAAEAAEPGRRRSPGSPTRPGRSASPEAAAEAAEEAGEAAEAAPAPY